MKTSPLLVCILLLSASCQAQDKNEKSSADTAKQYSKESLKTRIESTARYAIAGMADRETFRNQVKVLSLTVFFAIVGIALSKDKKEHRSFAITIACISSIGLYGMDTYLLDLTYREEAYRDKLNAHLLKWDVDSTQADSAYSLIGRGMDSSNPNRKLLLFFWFKTKTDSISFNPRLMDAGWYAFPGISYFLVGKYRKRKEKRRWQQMLDDFRASDRNNITPPEPKKVKITEMKGRTRGKRGGASRNS